MFGLRRSVLSASVVLLVALASGAAAHAELVIAPVFNRVAGSGPADNNFPLGVVISEADQVSEYVSGDPRDPVLDEVHVWNDSSYNITSFTLRIFGTGTDTEDPDTIVPDENVDARFGDVVDHAIASDIFPTVEISADGKEIRFSGGLIPPGGRFTTVHYADSDMVPEVVAFDYAAIESSFGGVLVPEPSSVVMMIIGLIGLGLTARHRK